ncbi:hypothetical protein PG995_007632 [Apiospora arundinis]
MIRPRRALADRPAVRQVQSTTPGQPCSMSHLHDTCQRLPTPRPEFRRAGPSFPSPHSVVTPTNSGCGDFGGAPDPNNGIPLPNGHSPVNAVPITATQARVWSAPIPNKGIPVLSNGIQLPYNYNPVNTAPITTTRSPPCPVSPSLKVPSACKGYQHPVPAFLGQGPSCPDPDSDPFLIYVTSRSTATSFCDTLATQGAKLTRANMEHLITSSTLTHDQSDPRST